MEEIYFRDVVHFFWRSKWWVAAAVTLSLAVGATLYANAVPQYEVTMTLVPADSGQNPWEQGAQGTASLASQFLGVPIGDRTMQKAQQFLSLFSSRIVLERVDKDLGLLQHFFWQSWDPVRAEWIEPTGWRTRIRTMLRNDIPFVAPNLVELSKGLQERVEVNTLSAGALVEIRFMDRDPAFGVALLQALYREADNVLRDRARLLNDEHISFIQKSLGSVSYAETRQSLTSLLTAEVGQRVMINSNSPYAMDVLKPPFANPRPVSPSLTMYTLMAGLAGVLLGFGASGIHSALRNSPKRQLRTADKPRKFAKAQVAENV